MSGLRLLMDAQRSYSDRMAEAFNKFHLDHINRAYETEAWRFGLLDGQIGQVDRFTIISTPHLPKRKPWR